MPTLATPFEMHDGTLLYPGGVVVHKTHYMEYQPCLFLECNKCFLSLQRNADELASECTEDIHEINNARIRRT